MRTSIKYEKNPQCEHNLQKTTSRSVQDIAEIERIEREAIANFSGQLPDLESALGVLHIGAPRMEITCTHPQQEDYQEV